MKEERFIIFVGGHMTHSSRLCLWNAGVMQQGVVPPQTPPGPRLEAAGQELPGHSQSGRWICRWDHLVTFVYFEHD